MKKATHNGTCQVCGREQALPGGKLAKHGYDVQFHFFNGVCPGADHLPLEQDRKFADEVAAGLLVTSRSKAADAVCVSKGELLPTRAKSGKRVQDERGRWVNEMVPYAEAPEQYREQAVESLHDSLVRQSKSCADTSASITARANRVTGKQALAPRVAEARKVIVAGTRFKLHGVERVALRIEDRMCRGCGPFLNGNWMPHVIFDNGNGKEYGYPVRLIRQAAIIEGA